MKNVLKLICKISVTFKEIQLNLIIIQTCIFGWLK